MNFADFCIKPENLKEAERMIAFAKKLGFSGLCILIDLKQIEKLRDKFPELKIFSCIVVENLAEANSLKEKHDLIFAKSKDMDFNRKICETPDIDVFLDPYNTSTCQFDQVMARLCAKNKISVGFSLSNLIFSDKLTRSNLIKSMFELSRILVKYKTPFKLVSGAVKKEDMRSPSELIAFGRVLGFESKDVKKNLYC